MRECDAQEGLMTERESKEKYVLIELAIKGLARNMGLGKQLKGLT